MAAKKIVITGAGGLLGTYLMHCFADQQPIGLTSHDLDITDQAVVQRVISELAPNIIINAAAFTAVDACEKECTACFAVNGLAPGYLAAAASTVGATLVHYSTDYIFYGDLASGYPEDWADQQPINVYGESKLAGERAIAAAFTNEWRNVYLIRTAWLYGAYGKNFVDTMLDLAKRQTEIKVVNDQHGSPTYAFDLAKQTQVCLEQQLPFGIYHCTNSGVCSWFEFAQKIFELAGLAVKVQPCISSEFPRPAKRPQYSVLLNTKLPALRPWQDALAEYLTQRKSS